MSPKASKPAAKKAAKAAPAPKAKPVKLPFELGVLDALADWLDGSPLEEVEIEQKGLRLRLKKPGGGVAVVAAPAPAGASKGKAEEAVAEEGETFKSPMVGTFYAASGPDAAPFVRAGDSVRAGQTLCIIEAMKTMNPITADKPGVVRKVLAQNAQPVEYGQPLFVIE